MQNLLLKIPYKFKKSYGGTPEPHTTQDAPWRHGPSLNISDLWRASARSSHKFVMPVEKVPRRGYPRENLSLKTSCVIGTVPLTKFIYRQEF
jgi:hypothetical protein